MTPAQATKDLDWYYQVLDHDLGFCSNFSAMLEQMAAYQIDNPKSGADIGIAKTSHSTFQIDLNDKATLKAVARMRRIRSRLTALGPAHLDVLYHVFALQRSLPEQAQCLLDAALKAYIEVKV